MKQEFLLQLKLHGCIESAFTHDNKGMVRTKKVFSGKNSISNQFVEDYRQFGESFNLNDNRSEIMLAVKDA